MHVIYVCVFKCSALGTVCSESHKDSCADLSQAYALHCVACVALHCAALCCIALRCIAGRCIALQCNALRCIAVHCMLLLSMVCMIVPQTVCTAWLLVVTIYNMSVDSFGIGVLILQQHSALLTAYPVQLYQIIACDVTLAAIQ